MSRLNSVLKQGISGIQWLDQVLSFLRDNEFDVALNQCSIALNQEGDLCKFSDLHPDRGIDEELKDIAHLLDWHVRSELRDTRLTLLAVEKK